MSDASGLPPSPLEVIAAINRAEGRDSGPLTAGYVDENGMPITPQWNTSLGLSPETLRVPPQVRQPQSMPEPERELARETWMRGPEQEVRNVALVELPNIELPPEYVRLDSGAGVWRENAFTLTQTELVRIKRIVVGAMTRANRIRERELRNEIKPPVRRTRRSKKEPSIGEAAQEQS